MAIEKERNYIDEISDILLIDNLKEVKIKFLEYHPFEQMDAFVQMNYELKIKIVTILSPDEIAPLFEQLDEVERIDFLKISNNKFNAKIMEKMSIDDAVDLLKSLDRNDRLTYISLFPKDFKEEVNQFLNYEESTAGSLMTNEYIEIQKNDNVKEAMKKMVKQAPNTENINDVFVIEDGKILGNLSLKELIVARAEEKILDIMHEKFIFVKVYEDQEIVSQLFRDYDLIMLPVIDDKNNILGVISIDDIVDIIDEEATENYSRFAAISNAEINHDTETIWTSVKKRLPWLIVLLVLGIGVSSIISGFEEVLSEVIILSFFMTMILDMAGNTGTQALAVTVRGLTTKQFDTKSKTYKHIFREILTGAVNGALVGMTVFAVSTVFLMFKETEFDKLLVSLVVSLSMVISLTVSTFAGAWIPIIMNKFKIDPAVASGPFITTINDVIALVIYFKLAELFLL